MCLTLCLIGKPVNRGAFVDGDSGAPMGSNTIAEILSTGIAHDRLCDNCENTVKHCPGIHCVKTFLALQRKIEDCYIEIRKAGDTRIGVGVFAKAFIPKGTVLCEYMGRLLPFDGNKPNSDWTYVFNHVGSCYIDPRVYGNVSRFVNHHCTSYNLNVVDVMYGKRRVLAYKAKRDIEADSELFVSYGPQYWTTAKPCLCDAAKSAHTIDDNGVLTLVPTKQPVKSKSKLTRAPFGAIPVEPAAKEIPKEQEARALPPKFTRPAGVKKKRGRQQ